MRIGHGLGQPARFDLGQITMLEETLCMNCTTVLGDSGGPMFRNNKLIGISQAISVAGDSPVFTIDWAIPIANDRSWLPFRLLAPN